jgi:hypothetical protein
VALDHEAVDLRRVAGCKRVRHLKPSFDAIEFRGLDDLDREACSADVLGPAGAAAASRVFGDYHPGQAAGLCGARE